MSYTLSRRKILHDQYEGTGVGTRGDYDDGTIKGHESRQHTFGVVIDGGTASVRIEALMNDPEAGDPVYVAGTNQVQRLIVSVDATSGTIKITRGGVESGSLDWDASEAEVVAALESFADIGVGDVDVTALGTNFGDGYDVEYINNLARTVQPALTLTSNTLDPASTDQSSITVAGVVRVGQPQTWYPVSSAVTTTSIIEVDRPHRGLRANVLSNTGSKVTVEYHALRSE